MDDFEFSEQQDATTLPNPWATSFPRGRSSVSERGAGRKRELVRARSAGEFDFSEQQEQAEVVTVVGVASVKTLGLNHLRKRRKLEFGTFAGANDATPRRSRSFERRTGDPLQDVLLAAVDKLLPGEKSEGYSPSAAANLALLCVKDPGVLDHLRGMDRARARLHAFVVAEHQAAALGFWGATLGMLLSSTLGLARGQNFPALLHRVALRAGVAVPRSSAPRDSTNCDQEVTTRTYAKRALGTTPGATPQVRHRATEALKALESREEATKFAEGVARALVLQRSSAQQRARSGGSGASDSPPTDFLSLRTLVQFSHTSPDHLIFVTNAVSPTGLLGTLRVSIEMFRSGAGSNGSVGLLVRDLGMRVITARLYDVLHLVELICEVRVEHRNALVGQGLVPMVIDLFLELLGLFRKCRPHRTRPKTASAETSPSTGTGKEPSASPGTEEGRDIVEATFVVCLRLVLNATNHYPPGAAALAETQIFTAVTDVLYLDLKSRFAVDAKMLVVAAMLNMLETTPALTDRLQSPVRKGAPCLLDELVRFLLAELLLRDNRLSTSERMGLDLHARARASQEDKLHRHVLAAYVTFLLALAGVAEEENAIRVDSLIHTRAAECPEEQRNLVEEVPVLIAESRKRIEAVPAPTARAPDDWQEHDRKLYDIVTGITRFFGTHW